MNLTANKVSTNYQLVEAVSGSINVKANSIEHTSTTLPCISFSSSGVANLDIQKIETSYGLLALSNGQGIVNVGEGQHTGTNGNFISVSTSATNLAYTGDLLSTANVFLSQSVGSARLSINQLSHTSTTVAAISWATSADAFNYTGDTVNSSYRLLDQSVGTSTINLNKVSHTGSVPFLSIGGSTHPSLTYQFNEHTSTNSSGAVITASTGSNNPTQVSVSGNLLVSSAQAFALSDVLNLSLQISQVRTALGLGTFGTPTNAGFLEIGSLVYTGASGANDLITLANGADLIVNIDSIIGGSTTGNIFINTGTSTLRGEIGYINSGTANLIFSAGTALTLNLTCNIIDASSLILSGAISGNFTILDQINYSFNSASHMISTSGDMTFNIANINHTATGSGAMFSLFGSGTSVINSTGVITYSGSGNAIIALCPFNCNFNTFNFIGSDYSRAFYIGPPTGSIVKITGNRMSGFDVGFTVDSEIGASVANSSEFRVSDYYAGGTTGSNYMHITTNAVPSYLRLHADRAYNTGHNVLITAGTTGTALTGSYVFSGLFVTTAASPANAPNISIRDLTNGGNKPIGTNVIVLNNLQAFTTGVTTVPAIAQAGGTAKNLGYYFATRGSPAAPSGTFSINPIANVFENNAYIYA